MPKTCAPWLAILALIGHLLLVPVAAGELQSVPPAPAPVLSLADLQGRPLDLSALRGKVVLINFWATYCKPCREEMPSLDRLRSRLGPGGFEVIGVDVAEDAHTGPRFLPTTSLGFPHPLHPAWAAIRRRKATALPTTIVVDRRGRIRARLTGGADWEDEAIITRLQKLMTEP